MSDFAIPEPPGNVLETLAFFKAFLALGEDFAFKSMVMISITCEQNGEARQLK